jgi:CPA1 family monovalent cation:H+ antiporter
LDTTGAAGVCCKTVRVHAAVWIVTLVASVTLFAAVARRLGIPEPLLLVVVGVVGSYLPFVPEFDLTPEIVLFGFLPPLLYAASLRTSLVDFRRNARPIVLLSVGLVIVTTVVVGFVTHWLLPDVPLAACFALGAVVAPPDAVAAAAIARRVGMPRRLVTILEGESLVNDATALVALRTAVASIGGAVTVLEVGWDFLAAAVGGIAVGIVVAFVTGFLRHRIKDELTDTSVSLFTPFLAFILAEELHTSGVLAVVVTGLLLAHKSHLLQSASSRVVERTTWATFQFVLENTVFLLIGLQVRRIIDEAAASDLGTSTIVWACLGVTLTVMVLRPLWVFPATYVPRWIPSVAARDPSPPWIYPAAVSWAGMRGVVTLAAVFVIPSDTDHRSVLVLIAMVVVGGTLLIQGATLPWVLRHLGVEGPDPAEDALQAAAARQRAMKAGVRRLDKVADGEAHEVIERLRRRAKERAAAAWEVLGGAEETPSQAYTRLRLEMIDAERAELIRLRDEGRIPADILLRVLAGVDVEESILDRSVGTDSSEREIELTPPPQHRGCDHIVELQTTPEPTSPDGCEECLAQGTTWVHLRLCMTCGHVGCCDSSEYKHATAHFKDTEHPVIRSFEPGEAWRWCFVDHALG